ncbi:MAG TPA: mandelate racemase/muconate lactonizing enzyme family protein [Bryobacteraceae bacterium]|nr:mandelate racemase/muconate lactonizing enzyme family protein [Bryobacteraceae bacterium]
MTRRQCLSKLGVSALPFGIAAISASPQRDTAKTLIGGHEIFAVHVNTRGDWILVRLTTNSGITGIGEASQGASDAATLRYVAQFAARLKGRSAFEIEWLRSVAAPEIATGGRSAACALSALEQCLWDIIGQALNVPVYDLFGGALRTAIRTYANINRSTNPRTPAGFASMAARAMGAGFDAVKLAPWDDMPADLSDATKVEQITQLGIDRATAVRQVLGPSRELLLDAHSKFDLARGLALTKLVEPLRLFWLEEVTQVPDLPAIRRSAAMPSAGGELIYGVKGFLPYINAESVDIVMPDVKYCGGMLELKKIASLAEAAGLRVSPHGPASPVGNVAAAHVCAGMPNFLILELSYGEVPWRAELIDPPEQIEKGFLGLTTRPGLGIRLNEKTAARYQVG